MANVVEYIHREWLILGKEQVRKSGNAKINLEKEESLFLANINLSDV